MLSAVHNSQGGDESEGWYDAIVNAHSRPLPLAGAASCRWGTGGVNVALPTNITAEDVAKVINEAELVGMSCSVDELATLAPVLGACATLRTFIVMDHEGCTNPQLPALVKQVRGLITCCVPPN